MKRLFTITLLTISMLSVSAQGQGKKKGNFEKIESAKIALITERLNLSPDQAQQFWPVYNEYAAEQRKLRRSLEEARRGHKADEATDEQTKELLQLGTRIKEQALKLEKDYSAKFLNVIDSRQLLSLRKAENDFKTMILKRIKKQRQQREHIQKNRQNGNQNMQRRRNNN